MNSSEIENGNRILSLLTGSSVSQLDAANRLREYIKSLEKNKDSPVSLPKEKDVEKVVEKVVEEDVEVDVSNIIWSSEELNRWSQFRDRLKDPSYLECYRIFIDAANIFNQTREFNLAQFYKKEAKKWKSDRVRMLCWIEVEKILNTLGMQTVFKDHPFTVYLLYNDRMIKNGKGGIDEDGNPKE
jgi:hypothetical protein